ncbi:MAG: type I-MYXAN CRISPR-associated protein Cas6/Cmx6 [Rhodocyclaceae bacterium]
MIRGPQPRVADLAFPVEGEAIACDYAQALERALCLALDWLEAEETAGVHPIRGLAESAGRMLISRRTRIVLRLPQERLENASRLAGSRLDLGGVVELGPPAVRSLVPYPVLYSRLVSLGCEDAAEFDARARRLAHEAGVSCDIIVGRRRDALRGQERFAGYGLMLHGLSPEDSLRIQSCGLGANRKLGCGVFIPHKSIAPV